MAMEKQGGKKKTTSRKNVSKEKATGKSLSAGSLLEEKTITEKPGVTKRPALTEKAETAERAKTPKKSEPESHRFKKEYNRGGNMCKVTFRLPKDAASKAQQVTIVGDFNNWDKSSLPMKKMENGDFALTLELGAGMEFRFRYLIDGKLWENDWHADKYVKSPYGVEDSVVCT